MGSPEPERDADGIWHISGSLVAAPKPRLKKLLRQLSPQCGNATLVCSLPYGCYTSGKCWGDKNHLENSEDEDYGQIFVLAIASCQAALSSTRLTASLMLTGKWRACSAQLSSPSGMRRTPSTSQTHLTVTLPPAWPGLSPLRPSNPLRTSSAA